MTNSTDSRWATWSTFIRWSARLLSASILLFWGFFIIAHLLGEEGRASRPLVLSDYLLLISMAVWLVGLAVAWKWELVGGLIAAIALSIAAVINWHVLTFPGILVAVAAVLFAISWWLRRPMSGGGTIARARSASG